MKIQGKSTNMVKEEFDSSTIQSAMYNYERKYLMIKFKGGAIYKYTNVDDDTYRKFTMASSQGKFFNEMIKDNYACEKYSDDEYISEVKDIL